MPLPKGTPSRALFVVGAVGSILNSVAGIILMLGVVVYVYVRAFDLYLYFGIAGESLFMIGIILAAVGYLGVRRNYGYSLGIVSFVFCIIVSISIIPVIVIVLCWLFGWTYGYPYYKFLPIGDVLLGVLLVLRGVTHIISGESTGRKTFSMGTGIMLTIVGTILIPLSVVNLLELSWGVTVSMLVFICSGVWNLLFSVSEILATILFFMAQVPAKLE